MTEKIPRENKLKDVKDWISHLDSITDEEFVRSYLTGQKPEDHVIESKDPLPHDGDSLSTKERRPDPSNRASNSGYATKRLNQKREMPVDSGTTDLQDEELNNRLTGDADQDALTPISPPEEQSGNQPRVQAIPQPESKIQSDSNLIAARPEQLKIEEPDFDQLRAMALKDYDPDMEEDHRTDRSSVSRMKKWFHRLSFTQKMDILLGTLVVLGVTILLIVFFSAQSPQKTGLAPAVAPAVYQDPSVPIPILAIFPDGQSFNLEVGNVENGSWTPRSAEWLAGSEVPRWLSLPWNKNLEKTIRAYTINEPIQLKMSNNDMLVYRFQSVQEISAQEMGTFHANTTDLLIILSKPNTSKRLVILSVR
jgi:hypothetical protein